MKLKIYFTTLPETVEVDATPIDIDPRLKACIHRAPFDLLDGWVVSEMTSGFRICKPYLSKDKTIAEARRRVNAASDEKIRTALGEALNKTSDVGEFIAFELPKAKAA